VAIFDKMETQKVVIGGGFVPLDEGNIPVPWYSDSEEDENSRRPRLKPKKHLYSGHGFNRFEEPTYPVPMESDERTTSENPKIIGKELTAVDAPVESTPSDNASTESNTETEPTPTPKIRKRKKASTSTCRRKCCLKKTQKGKPKTTKKTNKKTTAKKAKK